MCSSNSTKQSNLCFHFDEKNKVEKILGGEVANDLTQLYFIFGLATASVVATWDVTFISCVVATDIPLHSKNSQTL